MLKLAVLISGRGSNLKALISAAAEAKFPAKIVHVISNRPEAAGLNFAKMAGIPTTALPQKDYKTRGAFDEALDRALEESGAELVCLAGFMRLLTPWFVRRWRDRLINIHPSLLPAFPGLHTHAQAIHMGVKFSGCTVHYVREKMDEGPIILQAAVPVLPDDTPDTLSARILEQEHRCYPQAIRWIAEGNVRIDGKIVMIKGAKTLSASVSNPTLGN